MSEWAEKPLGQLADCVMGQSPNSSTVSELPGGLPFLQGCAEFGQRTPVPRYYVNPPLKIAPKNSTLISVRAPVGALNIADQQFGIGRGLAAVVARTHSNLFLRYAIECNTQWLHRRSQGSTFLAIGSDDLRKLPIRVAKEPAQCEAAVNLISNLDSQIEATEALIAKQERVRAGLLQDLLTRGVDNKGALRPPRAEAPHLFHQTQLGWLPKDWDVKQLQEVADVQRGRFGARPRNDPRFYGGPYPFIQTGELSRSAGQMIANHSQTLNSLGLATSRMFPAGTIAVSIAANIGDTAILSYPMCAPDSVVGVMPFDLENSSFLQLAISRKKHWLESRAPQTAQKNINLDDLRPLKIEFPKKSEREEIAQQVHGISSLIFGLETNYSKMLNFKSGLMRDLLTGRVPVDALLESEPA
jgi:type I restriction enzyme S subunit